MAPNLGGSLWYEHGHPFSTQGERFVRPYAEELIRCLLTNPTVEPTPTVTDTAEGNLCVEVSGRVD